MELLDLDIVDRIAEELSMEPSEVYRIAISADSRYREITLRIPGKKERKVYQPSSELRVIQRWCSVRLFSRLPVHESCFSYVQGRNIAMHAKAHSANGYLARIDIRNFFPSLQRQNVAKLLDRNRRQLDLVTEREVWLLSLFATRSGRLVIGAPSSPALSNALLYDFDAKWSQLCGEMQVIYTRYADDIYLSTAERNKLSDIIVALKTDLVNLPGFSFSINSEKDVFTSRRRLKRVTGIVITPQGELSLGRDKKRKVKALVHQALDGKLATKEVESLLGMLSHIDSIDSSFSMSLIRKYGPEYRKRVSALLASGPIPNSLT